MFKPVVVCVVLAVAAALAPPAVANGHHHPKQLPAFELSHVKFTPFAFQGEASSAVGFCERTTNVSNFPAPRRLHNVMYVQGPGVHGVANDYVARRNVPKLPGTVHHVVKGKPHVHHYSHYGCGRGTVRPITLPLGAYEVQICADPKVPQRETAASCFLCDKCFFVIKRSWITSTSSSYPLFGPGIGTAAETSQSKGATFNFVPPVPGQEPGVFFYKMAGSVAYTASGSFGGCTYSGSGVDANPLGTLSMDYANEQYSLQGASGGFTYPIIDNCGGTVQPDDVPGPRNPFLDSGGEQTLPFGRETVVGTFSNFADGATFNWNLH